MQNIDPSVRSEKTKRTTLSPPNDSREGVRFAPLDVTDQVPANSTTFEENNATDLPKDFRQESNFDGGLAKKKKSIQFNSYEMTPIEERSANPPRASGLPSQHRRSSGFSTNPRQRSSTSGSRRGSSSGSIYSKKHNSILERFDDDNSSEGSLVGEGSDADEDNENKASLPLFVPKHFEVVLVSGEGRCYDLTFLQQLYVFLTNNSSWYDKK